jgi:hypothetical protein
MVAICVTERWIVYIEFYRSSSCVVAMTLAVRLGSQVAGHGNLIYGGRKMARVWWVDHRDSVCEMVLSRTAVICCEGAVVHL